MIFLGQIEYVREVDQRRGRRRRISIYPGAFMKENFVCPVCRFSLFRLFDFQRIRTRVCPIDLFNYFLIPFLSSGPFSFNWRLHGWSGLPLASNNALFPTVLSLSIIYNYTIFTATQRSKTSKKKKKKKKKKKDAPATSQSSLGFDTKERREPVLPRSINTFGQLHAPSTLSLDHYSVHQSVTEDVDSQFTAQVPRFLPNSSRSLKKSQISNLTLPRTSNGERGRAFSISIERRN